MNTFTLFNWPKGLLLGFIIFLVACIDNQPWKATGKKMTQDTSQDFVSKNDTSKDLGVDGMPCNCGPGDECNKERECIPVCDPEKCASGLCVEGRCVMDCSDNADCPSIENSRCEAGVCKPCTAPNQCSHFGGVAQCTDGVCQCNNETDCVGMNICDTRVGAIGLCRAPGTKSTCEVCATNDECLTGYCVELDYLGESHGKFCVDVAEAGCSNPYTEKEVILNATGASLPFCIPNPSRTTCQAILAHSNRVTCSDDNGCPLGGSCRSARCSYSCKTGECRGNCIGIDDEGFGYCQ